MYSDPNLNSPNKSTNHEIPVGRNQLFVQSYKQNNQFSIQLRIW